MFGLEVLRNIARAMNEGISKEMEVSNHYHASQQAQAANNSKQQPKSTAIVPASVVTANSEVVIPKNIQAQEVPGVNSSVSPNQQEDNTAMNYDGYLTAHLAVKSRNPFGTDRMKKFNFVSVHGGKIYNGSQKGAFFHAWPIAFNGQRGAGIERIPGDAESRFFADGFVGNTRILELRSGGDSYSAGVIYEGVAQAINDEMERAALQAAAVGQVVGMITGAQVRRMQVVLVFTQLVPYQSEEGALQDVTFEHGPRAGQTATKFIVSMEGFVGAKVVFEGDPEYINGLSDDQMFAIETDEWIPADQLLEKQAEAKIYTSRPQIIEAIKKGEITEAEGRDLLFRMMGKKDKSVEAPRPRRTFEDFQNSIDAEVKKAEAAAPELPANNGGEAGKADDNTYVGDDAPETAV